MLFVHEVHDLAGRSADAFESLLADRWAPAVATHADSRLLWCARSMTAGISQPEIITITAIEDGDALARYGERLRFGDLRDEADVLDASRAGVTRRIVAALDFSPLDFDLATVPEHPEVHRDQGEIYVHDFVPPRLGMQREYEKTMREVFMFLREIEELGTIIWASFETIAGGGPFPENVMITHVRYGAEAAMKMLTMEIPREMVTPGQWLHDGMKMRDTWMSRLVRSVSWSPVG